MKKIILILISIIIILKLSIIGMEMTKTGLYIMVKHQVYPIVKWIENDYIQIDSN